jgi:hypothetical protein
MKKLITIMTAVAVILALNSDSVQATTLVNLSLEPITNTVNVGDSFSLELWMRSDPTGQSNDGADVMLMWDPSYVRLDGLVEDGDYDWMMAFFNDAIDDGDAFFTLFAELGGASPQTDLHAVSLTFTALAPTASSTSILIPEEIEFNGNPWFTVVAWEGEDITGELSGADITIVPEPATVCLLGLGALSLLRRRRA